jgi:hypothetical protein
VDGIASGSATLLDRRLWAPVFFRAVAGSRRIAFVHVPNPPSIDPGVMAFVWALLLAVYIYFGLLAVGSSAAFAIVIALVSFAAIWFFVRLRGEDRPSA